MKIGYSLKEMYYVLNNTPQQHISYSSFLKNWPRWMILCNQIKIMKFFIASFYSSLLLVIFVYIRQIKSCMNEWIQTRSELCFFYNRETITKIFQTLFIVSMCCWADFFMTKISSHRWFIIQAYQWKKMMIVEQ